MIQPGDFLFIKRGERVPADCVLISSDYDDASCFIETAELDGYAQFSCTFEPS